MVHSEHPVAPDQRPVGEEDVHHHSLDMIFADLILTPTYFVTDAWYVTASTPLRVANTDVDFLDEDRNILPTQSSIHHRNEALVGLGDISLLTGYRVWTGTSDQWTFSVDVGGGSTLPTGSTEPDPFALGREGIEHQHIMFGSGTFDPICQLNAIASNGEHTISLWSTSRLPLQSNEYGMKTGSQMSAGLGWIHGFGLEDWRFKVQPEVFHEEPTTWDGGETTRNSGRTDLVAGLGVLWRLSEIADASLTLKKPFTIEVQGGQLDMPIVVALGLNLRFDTRPAD